MEQDQIKISFTVVGMLLQNLGPQYPLYRLLVLVLLIHQVLLQIQMEMFMLSGEITLIFLMLGQILIFSIVDGMQILMLGRQFRYFQILVQIIVYQLFHLG